MAPLLLPAALRAGAAAMLAAKGSASSAIPAGCRCCGSPSLGGRSRSLAARFYTGQPETIVAVTGTNGKTSVASFVRQIWSGLGDARRQPRHHRSDSPVRRGGRDADDAGAGDAARAARRTGARQRHPPVDGSVQPRPRAEPARRRQDRRRRASPISATITSIITRMSRIISTRRSGCSRRYCRTAPLPSSMPTPNAPTRWSRSPMPAASR